MNTKALDKFFQKVRKNLDSGTEPENIDVNLLLETLEVSRRGVNVNAAINELLDKYDLEFEENFEWGHIYNELGVKRKSNAMADFENTSKYRIDSLTSANIRPISVKPTDTVEKALTIMTSKNFSQLPVMQSERNVKGVVTWKSLASKMSFSKNFDGTVEDYIEKAMIIDDDTSLFDAILQVKNHEYVLIKSSVDNRIKGIVTASDLSEQFRSLSEPFLLIGKCESLIRKVIYGKFSKDELNSIKNSNDTKRSVDSVHDLTFGEYVRLIEKEDRWNKLDLALDRQYVVERLNRVREIRNEVMHFNPDQEKDGQLDEIQEIVGLLEEVLKHKPANQ